MRPRPGLSGLVLCGGDSRRMGTDKALVELAGQPLVARVAERLGRVAAPVVLAPGRRGRLGPQTLGEVDDLLAGRGPLGGLVAGLRASPTEAVAVVAVDLPFASPALLAWLHRRWQGEAALVPVDAGGRAHPLHAVFASSAAGTLLEALEVGSGRVLDSVTSAGGRLLAAPHHLGDRWSINLNRPGDLARASVLAAGG